MIEFLRRKFIKDYENVQIASVREAHGKLASLLGIILNFFLFLTKLISGFLVSGVAVIADSVNNLSDMASSIISLAGFRLASIPPDKEHPYGHERAEYIGGFLVSVLILFVGVTLLIASVKKIVNFVPETVDYLLSYITVAILVLSIVCKLFQSLLNKKFGEIINSSTLKTTAADSRNDVIATSSVLLGTILLIVFSRIGVTPPFSIDGVLGVLVSLFIIVSGILIVKDTASTLIGERMPQQKVNEIVKFVTDNPIVIDVHDVDCHTYGPTKFIMTLHAGVNSTLSFKEAHDAIDKIEKEVREQFNVELTVHMDPVDVDNAYENGLKELVENLVSEFDGALKIHDFRLNSDGDGQSVTFDLVIPYKYDKTYDEITKYLSDGLVANGVTARLEINFDRGDV